MKRGESKGERLRGKVKGGMERYSQKEGGREGTQQAHMQLACASTRAVARAADANPLTLPLPC